MILISIPGRVAIKKNSTQRKYSFKRRRTITMPSDAYMIWQAAAVEVVRKQWDKPPLTGQLRAVFRFYFRNHQHEPDTSNCIEGPQDVLKRAGVIEDDKLIVKVEAEKFFGFEPRTEIEIYSYRKKAA